jgi:uncharacterized protein YoxC
LASEVRVTNQLQHRTLLDLTRSMEHEQATLNKMTNSVEGLTASVAQLTSRTNRFSEQLDAEQREMDDLTARLQSVEAKTRNNQPAHVSGAQEPSLR